jgi:hypothetical protein
MNTPAHVVINLLVFSRKPNHQRRRGAAGTGDHLLLRQASLKPWVAVTTAVSLLYWVYLFTVWA